MQTKQENKKRKKYLVILLLFLSISMLGFVCVIAPVWEETGVNDNPTALLPDEETGQIGDGYEIPVEIIIGGGGGGNVIPKPKATPSSKVNSPDSPTDIANSPEPSTDIDSPTDIENSPEPSTDTDSPTDIQNSPKPQTPTPTAPSRTTSNGGYSDTEPTTSMEQVLVSSDDGKNWHDEETLHIFKDYAYNFRELLAPGSYGEYAFNVENSNRVTLGATVKLHETNPYGLNMKYRLKQGDTYISGENFVSAEELENYSLIDYKQKLNYVLEWRWEESENDNEIGKQHEATYNLSLEIYVEQV